MFGDFFYLKNRNFSNFRQMSNNGQNGFAMAFPPVHHSCFVPLLLHFPVVKNNCHSSPKISTSKESSSSVGIPSLIDGTMPVSFAFFCCCCWSFCSLMESPFFVANSLANSEMPNECARTCLCFRQIPNFFSEWPPLHCDTIPRNDG